MKLFGFVHTFLQLTSESVAEHAVLSCRCWTACSVYILPLSFTLLLFLLFLEESSRTDDVMKYSATVYRYNGIPIVGHFLIPPISLSTWIAA